MSRADALIVAGFMMIGAGLYMIAPAAALIVCGGLLLAIGLAGALNERGENNNG